MIDKATIDRIFAAANIVEVVGDFVTLKKKGINYQACCPFHNEKTPSFVVSPSKGLFKCFGCGKGGNAVTFVMEHENMTYPEALKYVARKYGMDDVLDACRYYIEKTGRRVIFEYALVHGVNADPAQAVELAGRLRGMQCHVNLIPLNSVPERGLTGVTEREVDAFKHALEQKGISVTRRREMGDDIEGACGQLRRRYIQDNNLNTEN